jgi:LmbE family N-acetylglucosaminyl deacetylase
MIRSVAVVSPHLDDAALSCASYIAGYPGSWIVTAFAGGPQRVASISAWDAAGGFRSGDDVIRARRSEDGMAASALNAYSHHLDHWDKQYRGPNHGYGGPQRDGDITPEIAADIDELVDRLDVDAWLIPLGLGHADHRITAAACFEVVLLRPNITWLVYEELPYAVNDPLEAMAVHANREREGFVFKSRDGAEQAPERSIKRRAINCYASQLRPLGDEIEKSVQASELIRSLVPPA